jgi:hypothetical protein
MALDYEDEENVMIGSRWNRGMMWALSGLIVAAAGCSEMGGKRVVLFNGMDLNDWKALEPAHNTWQVAEKVELNPADISKFVITPGTGVMVNGPKGSTSNIFSTATHGDCKAHIEFVVPKNSNSGVYFQGMYEVQVFDSYGKKDVIFSDCGGVYARWVNNQNVDGKAPCVNASKAPGLWQSYDVVFKAPRLDASGKKIANARFLKVLQNGVLIHENVDLPGPTRASLGEKEVPAGPLMLQGDHGPVAYRNIWIEPLDLK